MNKTEPTLSFFEKLKVKLGMLKCPHCGKPLTLVAVLEGDTIAVPDPLAGQRTLLLLGGLCSLVPLTISSVQASWGGFVFAALAGP